MEALYYSVRFCKKLLTILVNKPLQTIYPFLLNERMLQLVNSKCLIPRVEC